jgi:Tfp pilus assembly protein PilF
MIRRRVFVFAFVFAAVLALLSPSFAQRTRGNATTPSINTNRTSDLTIRVTYPNDRPADKGLEVSLMAPHGGIVQEAFTDDMGSAQFRGIPPGRYRLRITGLTIETAELATFEINNLETVHYEYVHVVPKDDGNKTATGPGGGMISAADLNIPDKARKEFDRGIDSMQKSDMPAALEHFEKATAIYPQYALAYNNIGVVHIKAGETVQARQAFETAVSVNPKLSVGYLNLARLSMGENKYPDADKLIGKALTVEPNRAEALALEAQTQMMMGNMDEAYAYAKKCHAQSEHKNYSAVHLIAARVLEEKQQPEQALAEYQQFLKESPESPTAPKVRDAIARLGGPAVAAGR